MTSGDSAERSGEEPAKGCTDGATDGPIDGPTDGSTGGPIDAHSTAPANPDQPGERRRKAGVQYRPV
jgi:hypothetical protein